MVFWSARVIFGRFCVWRGKEEEEEVVVVEEGNGGGGESHVALPVFRFVASA
jgi:hypothetical protein